MNTFTKTLLVTATSGLVFLGAHSPQWRASRHPTQRRVRPRPSSVGSSPTTTARWSNQTGARRGPRRLTNRPRRFRRGLVRATHDDA